MRASAANLLKKSSSGPNMIDGRNTTAVGLGRQHRLLALGLGAGVVRRRILVGADRRHLDHRAPWLAAAQRHLLGAERLHGVEALPPALEQDADQIDDDVGVAHGGLDRAGVAHVGLHRMDLADPAERLQMAGEIGPAHRHADAVVALGQRPDHMAAEEPGAAKIDQRVVLGLSVMAALLADAASASRSAPAQYSKGPGLSSAETRRSIDKAKRGSLSVRAHELQHLPRWRNW